MPDSADNPSRVATRHFSPRISPPIFSTSFCSNCWPIGASISHACLELLLLPIAAPAEWNSCWPARLAEVAPTGLDDVGVIVSGYQISSLPSPLNHTLGYHGENLACTKLLTYALNQLLHSCTFPGNGYTMRPSKRLWACMALVARTEQTQRRHRLLAHPPISVVNATSAAKPSVLFERRRMYPLAADSETPELISGWFYLRALASLVYDTVVWRGYQERSPRPYAAPLLPPLRGTFCERWRYYTSSSNKFTMPNDNDMFLKPLLRVNFRVIADPDFYDANPPNSGLRKSSKIRKMFEQTASCRPNGFTEIPGPLHAGDTNMIWNLVASLS
ncbi:hypothetical protein FB45DRAFT_1006997 [Roridomyces roridus]|uniref:Uncharacterized protein n=1 Tax=Roridomyces roridus TaxID=1738132 RepID=A0AAD7FHK4_9AGAR|nr:hypothetical protein FB45DRAFT_1006997 [Roridomyces roridus]